LLVLVGASIHHAVTFKELTQDKTLDSIEVLSTFYGTYPDRNWKLIGERMRQELGGTDATISTSAVGSIPFYSRLKTVDAIGLCDWNVTDTNAYALSGSARPGHTQRVTARYLKLRGVNFVLDQPTPVARGVVSLPEAVPVLRQWALRAAQDTQQPDSTVTVVAMPLTENASLLMLYLTPTAGIDSVIRTQRWEVARIDQRPSSEMR
jgi:hypothetical protein